MATTMVRVATTSVTYAGGRGKLVHPGCAPVVKPRCREADINSRGMSNG